MARGLLARLIFAVLLMSANFANGQSTEPNIPLSLNEFVEKRLAKQPPRQGAPLKLKEVCDIQSDPIAARVFREYGAVFATTEKVAMPPGCLFASDVEVGNFQTTLETETIVIGDTTIELQKAAAQALKAAVDEAASIDKRVTALDGAIAGKRTYSDTQRIWNSRFFRGLDHWVFKERITRDEANYAATLPIREQIKRVMVWEANGFYFSTNFSISIFNSVAPPGTSQHLSLLAFDVVESSDPAVRRILNKHGWFQTIRSDEPHFTYLGVAEKELPSRGLMPIQRGSRTYWVPNIKVS